MKEPDTITVGDLLIRKVELAIKAALAYEKTTKGKRKLGITGEVGEMLACHQLGLRLVLDNQSMGYDAVDKKGKRVEIKTRRSESDGFPRDAGRVSRFSTHMFDYALLVLLGHDYRLHEIWQADYKNLNPIIMKNKRRNPSLYCFKHVAKRIFPKQ